VELTVLFNLKHCWTQTSTFRQSTGHAPRCQRPNSTSDFPSNYTW